MALSSPRKKEREAYREWQVARQRVLAVEAVYGQVLEALKQADGAARELENAAYDTWQAEREANKESNND